MMRRLLLLHFQTWRGGGGEPSSLGDPVGKERKEKKVGKRRRGKVAEREHDDCCWCGDRRRIERETGGGGIGWVLRYWRAYLVSLSSPGRVQREGENTALTYKGKCTAEACFLSDARHITTGVKKIG